MKHWNFIIAAYLVGLLAFAWDWFAPAFKLRALKKNLQAQQRRQQTRGKEANEGNSSGGSSGEPSGNGNE
jgi:hypothetical protein